MSCEDCLILIAEDDADDIFLLETAFNECGFKGRLSFVNNGMDAMEYLNNAKLNKLPYPNLMLLDINMPRKDGYEVLKEIKQNYEFANVPVIIFSTAHNERDMNRCLALGADEYIIKPDSFEALLQIISRIYEGLTNRINISA